MICALTFSYFLLFTRFHEFEVRKQCPEVFVIRRTLTQMANEARLDEVDDLFKDLDLEFAPQEKRLWVGETEVGVVYMRCGYHPDQYPTQR